MEVHEIVRYGTQGICRIQEISEKSFGASRRLYYVLKPVYHEEATIFVPVDNPELTGRMHRLLSAQEVLELLSGVSEDDGLWIAEEAKRRETYEKILRSGDRVGMTRLIRALSLYQSRLQTQHKKLHVADEALLKEAERELNEEIAYVLGLALEETPTVVRKLIEKEKEGEIKNEEDLVRVPRADAAV
ncbi:MAG: CarD family transcriptional regulator [Candidatus Spyradocola sp.]